MNFVTYAQLAEDVTKWSSRLARDFDAVLGVPRSGIIPASIFGLHRNIKVGDLKGTFKGGFRDGKRIVKKVLVLDDSSLTGKSILRARTQSRTLPFDCTFGAVYATRRALPHLDCYFKILPTPRIFEWNIYHHSILRHACVDIDGVLCVDPTTAENDDGKRYIQFLKTARPLHLPTVEVAALVTNRLEKYRPQTEEWLAQHNVKYKKLVMHPAKSKAERIKMGHVTTKAREYANINYSLFIESSKRQSSGIHRATQKPVLCVETMELLK
jgi:orotate phosphoribosyltransferase